MKRDELLTRLSKLLHAQFEEVVFRSSIPPQYLPGSSQAERAIAVIRYLEPQNKLDQLARILDELADIPPGSAASVSGQTQPASGTAGTPASLPARESRSSHTILFMAANPVGTDARALGEQARAIKEALERAGRRERFIFETRWAAQPLDLLREMVKLKPTVVHFCGGRLAGAAAHTRAAGVYFQAVDGSAQLVQAKALARAFAAVSSVKVVVLDACYSEDHASSIAAHIDCVVGVAGETVDGAATSFASLFYGSLGEGESVAAAFELGCAAVGMTAGDPDQAQLRVRQSVNAGQLVLTDPR
jgi:hypothetical protein